MVLDSWDEIESCILRRHPIRSIIDELRGKHAEIGHVAKEEEGERKEDDGMDDSPVESPPASSRIASLRPREHPRDANIERGGEGGERRENEDRLHARVVAQPDRKNCDEGKVAGRCDEKEQ